VELGTEEGAWLRRILLGDSDTSEPRLVARVRGRRVVSAIRSDCGPLRELPVDLEGLPPQGLWALRDAEGVARVVAIEADPRSDAELGVRPVADLLTRIGLEDGAYVFASPPTGDLGWRVACLRLRSGKVERIAGAAAIGVTSTDSDDALIRCVRSQVGVPRIVLVGSEGELRHLALSSRPLNQLERSAILGVLTIVARSRRLAVALSLSRLFEPVLPARRARRPAGTRNATSRA
jgi:hypothetical protein